MTLTAGTGIDALALELETEALAPEQVIAGTAIAGWHELDASAHGEWGVWELSESVTTDTEVDETFVVIRGQATVTFLDGDLAPLRLYPGVVARLAAGMRTKWTVTHALRKVVLVHPA